MFHVIVVDRNGNAAVGTARAGVLWDSQRYDQQRPLYKQFVNLSDGFTFGQLWEDIEEQMFVERGLDSACLDKLTTVEAKQFLQRKWWAWVEEQSKRGLPLPAPPEAP